VVLEKNSKGWSRAEKPKHKAEWVLGAQKAILCISLLSEVKQSVFRKKKAKVGHSRVEKPKFKVAWVLCAQKANLCISLLPGVKKSDFRKIAKVG
jgi:hypothetical protein